MSTTRRPLNALFDEATGALAGYIDDRGFEQPMAAVPSVASPTVLTSAGIAAAAAALYGYSGGGTVLVPATLSPIYLDAPIDMALYPGVTFAGAAPRTGIVGGTYALTGGGTVFQGDGTFPAFVALGQSGGSSVASTLGDQTYPWTDSAALVAALIYSVGLRDMAFKNFSYGVRIGARNNPGVANSIFRNLWAEGCTYWGLWFENFLTCTFDRMLAYRNGNGSRYLASGNTISLGNSRASNLTNYYNTGRQLAAGSRGASGLNDFHMDNILSISSSSQVNSAQACTAFTASATCTAAIEANTWTASISGYTMTVTAQVGAVVGAAIYVGQVITGGTVTLNTYVKSQLTGTPGGIGTYEVSISQTVASGTKNIGSILNKSAGTDPVLDQQITGTGISTASLATPLTYIVGGTTPSFGVSYPTTSAPGTTVTCLTPAFTVSDLSKFEVGMPVYFTTAVNGFSAQIMYFVRTMSAASGAGQLTVSQKMGWNDPVGATGTSAITITTKGWPLFSCAGEDMNSYVFSTTASEGQPDLEAASGGGGGSCTVLLQAIQSGGCFHIGFMGATTRQQVTTRSQGGCTIYARWTSWVYDTDAISDEIHGYAPTTVYRSFVGLGYQVIPSTMKGQLIMGGFTGPDAKYEDSIIKMFTRAWSWPAQQVADGGTAGLTGNTVTFTGTNNGAMNIPAPASTNYGLPLFLSNPTAFTATVTPASGTIVGEGASAATYALVTLTNRTVRCCKKLDGTYYWALFN